MAGLQRAIEIAVQAHRAQTRKDGSPYILHPMRVMFRVQDEDAQMAAILHDVVEDTAITLEELRSAGFSNAVLSAVDLLTHRDGVAYEAYVDAIADNPLARTVKLADLEDNMNVREIPELSDRDLKRTEKYHRAWKRLSTRVDRVWILDIGRGRM